MAELFGRDVKTIGKHIGNALKEELDDSTVAKFATTTQHGAIEGKTQTHMTEYYNLDVIISVEIDAGYYHSVGICSDGSVLTAGANYQGQCNTHGWNLK